MTELNETPQCWYVARTRQNQELALRDKLSALGVEHYLPTRIEVRQLKYRKKKAEVPVIRNMIFVRTTKARAYELLNHYGLAMTYMYDPVSKAALVVPERQMRDFMRVMNASPDTPYYEVGELQSGELVEIVCGDFAGIQGEFVSNANGDYVVIRLPQVLAITVQVQKAWLKKHSF